MNLLVPKYLQGMVQLGDSSNVLLYNVLVVLIKVNLWIGLCKISISICALGEIGFDFPWYKEIHILQDNTLRKLAVIILLLEQHEPLVLIRGLSKIGTLYLAALPGNTFPCKTVLTMEDPFSTFFCGVCLNPFPLNLTLT